MIVADELKLAQQADSYADSVCEKTSLSFYLWIKRNGWSYSESKGEWFDGMVRLNHDKLFYQFWKSCQNTTHVEAAENTERLQ